MKLFFAAAALFFSNPTFAGTDSMAIFWKSAQTMIVINESDSNATLKDFIQSIGLGTSFLLQSKSGDISLQCKAMATAASCTVKLRASSEVEVKDSSVFAYSNSENTAPLRTPNLSSATFENNKGERFIIWIDQFQIAAQAQKP